MPNQSLISDSSSNLSFIITLIEKWAIEDISHQIQKSPATSISSTSGTTVKTLKSSESLGI